MIPLARWLKCLTCLGKYSPLTARGLGLVELLAVRVGYAYSDQADALLHRYLLPYERVELDDCSSAKTDV
jgi:hypothetical protein